MSTTNRVWCVEEFMSDGVLTQRHTEGKIVENDDGTWHWVRPDERLTEEGKQEWDAVMKALKNVAGKDLRHVVCSSGLVDHCMRRGLIDCYKVPDENPAG